MMNQSINSLQDFYNTPQFMMNFGQVDAAAPVQDQFRADPGYQFAMDEGMNQINQNASARGLLESGRALKDLMGYSQGMADQNYQRWQGQRNTLMGNHQGLLSALANPAMTGAAQGQQMGQLLASNGQDRGNNLATLLQGTGANIMSGYAGQGGAMSTNLQNAASLQAQQNSANQSSNQQMMSGIGQLLGGINWGGGGTGGGGWW